MSEEYQGTCAPAERSRRLSGAMRRREPKHRAPLAKQLKGRHPRRSLPRTLHAASASPQARGGIDLPPGHLCQAVRREGRAGIAQGASVRALCSSLLLFGAASSTCAGSLHACALAHPDRSHTLKREERAAVRAQRAAREGAGYSVYANNGPRALLVGFPAGSLSIGAVSQRPSPRGRPSHVGCCGGLPRQGARSARRWDGMGASLVKVLCRATMAPRYGQSRVRGRGRLGSAVSRGDGLTRLQPAACSLRVAQLRPPLAGTAQLRRPRRAS